MQCQLCVLCLPVYGAQEGRYVDGSFQEGDLAISYEQTNYAYPVGTGSSGFVGFNDALALS